MVICTVPAVAAQIRLCGTGVVFVNGAAQTGAQFVLTCDPDPLFSVAVLNGSVDVTYPGGAHGSVDGGQLASCDPTACQSEIGVAGFPEDQMAIFAAQSQELHWVPPPTTTSTSTSTTTSTTTATTVGPTTTSSTLPAIK
jgi:hypothetical protein